MKTLITLFSLVLSTSAFAQIGEKQFTYNCECTKGACESQEHLNFLVDGTEKLKILLGDEEWEFNASLRAKKSKKASPAKTTRYEVSKNNYYDGTPSLAVDTELLSGWIAGNAKSMKRGKVLWLNEKTDALVATYTCISVADDHWKYNP